MTKSKKNKPHKVQAKAVQKLSPGKKILFTAFLFLIPVLFFTILELIFHVIDYGEEFNLVITKEIDQKKVYQLNPRVGELYFSKMDVSIPEIYPQTFEMDKSSDTYRIFCLGGSTTASFPYELNARFSSLLQDRLSAYFPGRKIEVINAGMSAINSYTVKDFARQLINYDPDLFVLYMGHNEFYGAYGIGSTQYLGKSPAIINLYLRLLRVKTFLFLRNTISHIQSSLSKSDNIPNQNHTLMEVMVNRKTIAYNSDEYNIARRAFFDNLKAIINIAKKRNVPIVISNLVCNEKDFAPFESTFSPSLTTEQDQQWQQLFDQGLKTEQQRKYRTALDFYQQAVQIDSMPAAVFYQMGRCYLALNEIEQAKQFLQQARDYDILRFRASEDFNTVIRELCDVEKVPFADTKGMFENHSPNGIIGNELMLEHLHPNFGGYFLMAKAFASTIVTQNLINSNSNQSNMPDESVRKLSYVTDFDLEIANLKIENLTQHWPFKQKVALSNPAKKFVTDITHKYIQGKIGWNHGHYELAEYYVNQRQYSRAIDEYNAVLKVIPNHYFPYYQIGDIYFQQNKFQQAAEKFAQAVNFYRKSPAIFAKLALSKMYLNSYADAKKYFDEALSINNTTNKLNKDEVVTALYYAAICNIHLNEIDAAELRLKTLLNIEPEHRQANDLLRQMKRNR